MPIKPANEPQLFPVFSPEIGRIVEASSLDNKFRLRYDHPHGKLFEGDSIAWLKSLESASIDLVVADPPYNLAKAEWDTFENQEAYIKWSMQWIEQAARVLKATGSMYVCGFSEILADLRHPASRFFKGCRWIIWHYKNKANLGGDWGRSHESILHLRKTERFRLNVDAVRIPYGNHTLKYPSHPQAATSNFGNGTPRAEHWTPNPLGAKPKDVFDIPTTSNGMGEKTPHPTQKPEELIRKLVLAASTEGATVLDPFSGSGTTAVVAEQLQRRWLVCESTPQYNEWAIDRIANVHKMSVEAWASFDRKNAARRESIR